MSLPVRFPARGWLLGLAVLTVWVLSAAPAAADPPAGAPQVAPAPPAPTAPTAPTPAPPPRKPEPVLPHVPPAGHGWFTLLAGPSRGTALMHLPPRAASAGADGGGDSAAVRAAENAEGVVRLAPGFAQPAEQVAWWQNRVYIALKSDRKAPIGKSDYRRRILSVTTTRAVTGGWEYPPGRPEVAATLPGRGLELAAFGACRLGPVALVRHGASSEWIVAPSPTEAAALEATKQPAPPAGELELAVYAAAAWRWVDLPWASDPPEQAPNGPFWIDGASDELTIFGYDAGAPAVRSYTARIPATVPPKERGIPLEWTTTTFPLTQSIAGAALPLPEPEMVCRLEGGSVAAAWDAESGGELRLFWLRPQRPAEEGSAVTGVPRQHTLVPMDGSGRLAVIWPDEDPAAGGPGQSPTAPEPLAERSPRSRGSGGEGRGGRGGGGGYTGLQIREISATTGKVLYSGPLRTDYWLSMREYQVLAAMLVLVMGSVIVFVLRTEPTATPILPKGVALAEPGRRFLAALIDYLPAALLVETLFSLPTGTLLLPSQIASEQFTLWALLAALGIAATHTTLGEWAFGRSLGKLMTGCVLVSARPSPAGRTTTPVSADGQELSLSRPAAWQCLVRNLLKWLAPMLGVFMLFDPGRRHPGDVLAKTLVILGQVQDGD